MAKRAKKKVKKGAKKAAKPPARKPAKAKKAAAKGGDLANVRSVVKAGAHDLTNLATAVISYLELLSAQVALDERSKRYVAHAREQIEMMVDLAREMKEKVGE